MCTLPGIGDKQNTAITIHHSTSITRQMLMSLIAPNVGQNVEKQELLPSLVGGKLLEHFGEQFGSSYRSRDCSSS